ncbi:sialidase family protein [Pedobacter heparinus]|uniref:sialidase family protein n=1 Tax=Pedobacter heparinus TaxID=984 RepID=UPI0029317938|nr:sialidase family protein [Pedobacter heparinus]
MKTKQLTAYLFVMAFTSLFLASCYKEEHFDFPGPFKIDRPIGLDSLPFPFDSTRQAGKWLMKDGVPDYERILFKGYTDYFPKGDTLSWVQKAAGAYMTPHYNYYPLSNADHFAGDPNSYKFNWVYSKYFVPVGGGKSFYMYAKVTFGTFNATAAGLVLGKNWDTGGSLVFGMDGGSGEPTFFVDVYGQLGATVNPALGWPTVTQVMTPGVPADLEVIVTAGIFYVKINGTLVFSFKLGAERMYYFTPQIRPWRNFVNVHDVYIESTDMYTPNYAMHEYEGSYNKIQAPALAKTTGGDLLLFAEGRGTPTSAKERVAQNTIPVGNTDIIMKRSTDGGNTWSNQLTVLAGNSSNMTYCFPQVVTADNGKIILQYSTIGGTFPANSNTFTYDASSQRIYQIESSDNGTSWSAPIEITAFKNTAAGYIQGGAGHGIVLTSATYNKRLVMPLTYSTNVVRMALSDDGGGTWRLGKTVSGSRLKQGTVVELSDGRLMMIAGHTNTSPKNRLVSYSSDGGDNWTAASNISSDVKTADYGHLFGGTILKGKNGEILYISPINRETDPEVKNSPAYAVAPMLFKSINNGQVYTTVGPLFTREAYFGYNAPIGNMDAAVLNDGTVVIAGEGGVESPAEGIVIYKK